MLVNKQSFRIPSLDGLRTAAFFIVFLGHAGLGNVIPAAFGVTVFFFLSGYLITTLMRIEYEQNGSFSFKNFYLRRSLRILPPFYIVLILSTALTAIGFLDGKIMLPGVAAQALHYANYWIIGNGNGLAPGTQVYWSLAVEEHFYLIFPWLYVLLLRLGLTNRQQAFILLGICGAVLVWRCVLVFGSSPSDIRTRFATDTRIDSLLFGCVMAIWGNPVLDKEVKGRSKIWRQVLLPAGLTLLILSFVVRDPAFRETFRYSIQGLGLYPVFMVAIQEPNFVFFRVLNWGWVSFMGFLSYSLYLVHAVVLSGVRYQLPIIHPIFQSVFSFAISLLIAWVIYLLIEKPCAKLRKRYTSR